MPPSADVHLHYQKNEYVNVFFFKYKSIIT